MKRAASLAVVLALATACSGGSTHQAAPTPTTAPTESPTATPTTAAPATPTPTPVVTKPPVATGPAGTAVPKGFVPQSATFVSDKAGWVLGASPCPTGKGSCDVIARTRDGGATWKAIPSPKTTPDHLAQIRMADALNGYVTGDQLWATHDGGASWKVVAGVGDVQGIAAAAGRVWINKGGALQSAPTSGGAFVTEKAPAQINTFVLRGSAVVAGSSSTTSLYSGAHDASFAIVKTPCAADARAIPAVAAADRWLLVCAGDAGLGHEEKHAFRSTDAGATWKAVGDPPQLTGSDLYLTTDGDVVIDHQSVTVSRDADKTWQTALMSDGGLSEGGFESAVLGYAIGGFHGSADSSMEISRDAGRHWSQVAF